MTPEQRLSKIRSIIKSLERQMDLDPDIDQMPILREAVVQIVIALGPQISGKRKRT